MIITDKITKFEEKHCIYNYFLAELMGTFILVFFAVGIAVVVGIDSTMEENYFLLLLVIATGFGVSIIIALYCFGSISGGHFNPAVSFSLLINKKISLKKFFIYVGAQFIGSILAMLILYLLLILFIDKVKIDHLGANSYYSAYFDKAAQNESNSIIGSLIVEILLTTIFVLAVLIVTSKKNNLDNLTPIIIGIALAGVHLIGISFTGTSVNPARSFGPALISLFLNKNHTRPLIEYWVFLIGPLIGAYLAAVIAKYWIKTYN